MPMMGNGATIVMSNQPTTRFHPNLPPHQQAVQRLADEFNAAEAIWRKLEWKRKLRRLLHPKMSWKKRKQVDLADFAPAQPPKDCIGYGRV